MDGEDRTGRIDVADERLALALEDLSGYAWIDLVCRPVGPIRNIHQKASQPPSRPRASRKKMMLATPRPKISQSRRPSISRIPSAAAYISCGCVKTLLETG